MDSVITVRIVSNELSDGTTNFMEWSLYNCDNVKS